DIGTYISHFIVQKPLKMTIRFLPSLIAVVVFICLYGTRTVDVTYLGIALYLEYCLYYYLGIAVRELKDANKLSFLDNKLTYWILLVLTGAVYFSFACGLESSFVRHNKSQFVLGDPLNLLLSTCGVLFFYLVAIKIPKNKGTVLFSKLSKFSLESYWAHPNLLKWWGVWAVPNLALAYLSAFAMTLMCLGFILVSIFIIYQIPFLHFLAFGKSYSRYKFERKCLYYLS
ncbi:MAG: hypothetical protein K5694_01945, partial [Bacilli bacterium]|nr:hypothetical protein [Bacilli bacterium]